MCSYEENESSPGKWMVLSVLLILGVMSWTLISWALTPQVYLSYKTRQCIRVVPKESGTCEKPPKKYEIVWVP